MKPSRFVLPALFAFYIPDALACDHRLAFYKLEVERLHLLLRMDASTLRMHYEDKMQRQEAECNAQLARAQATIHMQQEIIKRMAYESQQGETQ